MHSFFPEVMRDIVRRLKSLRLRRRPPAASTYSTEDRLPTPAGVFAVSRWLSIGLLAAVVAIAGAARLYAVEQYSYAHPDEEIARAVVSSVLKTGDNDTNWDHTDVAKQFHYTEYNFSSYYLFAAYVERFAGHTAMDLVHQASVLHRHLRQISAALGTLCVLFAGILGWRTGGRMCGLLAALLSACSITLFQDSLYARPECFVTLLTLLLALALTSERVRRTLVLLVAGVIVGLLISCKITFVIYLPFPVLLAPALLSTSGGGPARRLFLWSADLCVYFAAVGIGFALGAPYAVQNPWEFTDGLGPLLKQYASGFWPNGLGADSTLAERIAYGGAYLAQTIGYPALLMALVGLGRLIWRRNMRLILICAGPLLTLVYFLQTKAFFERNFSQALPIVFLLSGMGVEYTLRVVRASPRWRVGGGFLLAALCAATPVYVLAGGVLPALDGRYQKQIEDETRALSQGGHTQMFFLWWNKFSALATSGTPLCGSYIFFTRDFSRPGQLEQLTAHGYQVAGRVESVFGDYPVSTLQTYLAPSMIYLAPRPQPEGSCTLELAPLAAQPGERPLDAPVVPAGGWPMSGPPALQLPMGWRWPVYDSWRGSDHNVGSLQIGPFKACGAFVVPVTRGAGQSDILLRIVEMDTSGQKTLYSDIPPTSDTERKWQELIVHQPANKCGHYIISAVDGGKEWQEWIGVGLPVVLPDHH